MQTSTLPQSPDFDHLKRQGKELYKSFQGNDPDAILRVHQQIPNPTQRQQTKFMLCDALMVIAREYGFTSWMALKTHIEKAVDGDAEIIDKKALAVYEKMVDTIRKAKSLYLECDTQEALPNNNINLYSSKVWLKKPSYLHISTSNEQGEYSKTYLAEGILHGYWPKGRPWFNMEDLEIHAKTKDKVFYKTEYDVSEAWYSRHGQLFGPMPILDPSLFFKDDIWISRVSECHLINVNLNGYWVIKIVFHERFHKEWELKIDASNNMPLEIAARVNGLNSWSQYETWRNVEIDKPIDDSVFFWAVPQNWTEWNVPDADSTLIKPGNKAPDFELKTLSGNKLKLSSLLGNKILLIFGSGIGNTDPVEFANEFREEIRKCHTKGIIIIGFNTNDEPTYLRSRLEESGLDIPIISDPSEETWKVLFKEYSAYASPTYYLIDGDGIIEESWSWQKESLQNIFKRLAGGDCTE